MSDPYNLQRFVDAQARVYDGVLGELRRGRKTAHWMWFVFPQVAGLGGSPMSQRYAIGSIDEAMAYAEHETLGRRLTECTTLVTGFPERAIGDIFHYPDDLKYRSCMTLFDRAVPSSLFEKALDIHFRGERDPLTLRILDTG